MTLTITDLFCGGGGSSTGAIQVPGVEIKIAANHWDLAVQVHNENHPTADHAAVDLHEEDPRYFPRTDILWASPECTKWSQASGGKYSNVSTEANLLDLLDPDLVDEDPETAVVQRSRLLMFDVLRFAEHHRYKAMVIENVVDVARNPKFADAWELWKKSLARLGYDFRVVSLNSMHAQAHGDPAPQSRDRLYVVCWLKGNRVPDIDKVMRPLAWCPLCQSVVESQQVWKNGRTVGKYRTQYVYLHGACGTTVEPGYLPAAAAIDWSTKALVEPPPFIAELRGGGSKARSVEQPVSTITASGNHHGLVMPYYGASQSSQPTSKPIGTLTTVDRYALIQRHNSSKGDGAEMLTPADEVMRTLTTSGHQSLLTPGDIVAAEAHVDDCLFRMLEPHEVAAGMAFPADYIWGGTRRERVKLCGNAVTPPAARDLIAAVVESLT